MSSCTYNETAVKDAVDESIREAFETMVGEELVSADAISCPVVGSDNLADALPMLTVQVGLAGETQGLFYISIEDDAAIEVTRVLIGEDMKKVNQSVVDAIGELGNIVVGGAKRRLAGNNLTLSLPSVARTGPCSFVFPTRAQVTRLGYRYREWTLTVTIAMDPAS